MEVHRGEVFYADLSPVVGSEQGGVRPVLIVQNDTGNRYSPTVIAAAITSQRDKTNLPTHIALHAERTGLQKDSIVLLEQVRTIDKHRLKEKMGKLDDDAMQRVNEAIDQYGIDLLVCGHHQSFWSLLVSSARQLMNQVPCEMLVIPLKG